MAGVQKMKVSCENNIVTVDGVNDFTLSQILECGQCFHFDKQCMKSWHLAEQ